MYIQDDSKKTPMRELIRQFPDLASTVMSKCLMECPHHDNIDKLDYAVIFNFDLIEDAFLDLRDPHKIAATCCTDDVRQCSAPTQRENSGSLPSSLSSSSSSSSSPLGSALEKSKKPCPLGWINIENDVLMLMIHLKRDELIQHPLIVGLLSFRKLLLYVLDVNCIGFALLFAIFISIVMTHQNEGHESCSLAAANESIQVCGGLNATCVSEHVETYQYLSVSYTSLFAVSCIGYVITLFQIMTDGSKCYQIRFLLDLLSYTLGALVSVDMERCPAGIGYVVTLHWQWTAGIICLFLAWLNFIHKLMDISYVGVFVLMIYEVLKTFLKILFVLIPFLDIFTLIFYSMLHWAVKTPFDDPGQSMLRTFVMTLGEIDYANVLAAIRASNFRIFDQLLIFAVFIFFLIIMPIIVMNLLLGLAIGDIESIRKVAGTNDLKTKALASLAFQYSMPLWAQMKIHKTLSDVNILGGSKIKVRRKL